MGAKPDELMMHFVGAIRRSKWLLKKEWCANVGCWRDGGSAKGT